MTTVARTIEDLRGVVPSYLVRRAIRQAEFMGLRLDGIETNRTRSDLEEEFLRLCRLYGLPTPDLDLRGAGFAVHRFSERQLEEEPGRVVADVARALGKEVFAR